MKRLYNSRIWLLLAELAVVLALTAGNANADFIFGEPVNLRTVIPVIDPVHESIECFSTDGLEIYIDSDRAGGQGNMDLWVLRRDSINEDWGLPENLGPAVNSPQFDSGVCISADGLTLYFSSNRPGGTGGWDIYMATRTTRNGPWSASVNLGPKVNSARNDGGPWISANGLELYFASVRSGGHGRADAYVARRATPDDPWGEAANLGPIVNSPCDEAGVALSRDGLLLFFSDDPSETVHHPGGYGGSDMWVTRRTSLASRWESPVNLGPKVNSAIHELLPRLSSDSTMLYFSSARSSTDFTTWENWQAPIIPVCDFNGDGRVDGKDVLCMAGNWDTDDRVCDIGPLAWGDGVVDLNDLVVLTEHLGTEVVDPTLAAHWKLDEAEGMITRESVGGDDSYVLGGATWEPAGGQVDGAIMLDGVDDCVVAGFVLDPAEGPFSVLAWVKGGAPGQVVVSEPTGANWLMADAEGRLMTELTAPGRNGAALQSQTIITDGQWHRIGFVWDGFRRMLYCDGVVAAEDLQDTLKGSGSGQYIGAGHGMEPGAFWSGSIDDVRIYSRAVRP